jgi:putative flippase GtrA
MTPVLVKQVARFGVVGLTAALVHYLVVLALVQAELFIPLTANVLGFLCGFQVSYWGHRQWTFQAAEVDHKAAISKMLIVQGGNFLGNEALFYYLLKLNLPYTVALLIVLAVLPCFTFIASKFWVFD